MKDIILQDESFKYPIIIFDGVCHLCHQSIQWIIQNDKEAKFKYCTLQYAQESGFLDTAFDSVISYIDGELKIKSSAALMVLKILGGKYKLLYYFGRLVPRFIRDFMYDFVANNRYKWFGKYETCMLPPPDWKERFIG